MPLTLEDLLSSPPPSYADYPAQDKPAKKKATDYGIKDTLVSAASGAGGLINSVATFVGGSDSGLAKLGQNAEDYWNAEKSDELRAQEAELGQNMQEGDWLGAGKTLVTNPRLLASTVSSSLPATVVGMGAGGLVAKGALGVARLSEAGMKAAQFARLATAGGEATGLGGGIAAGVGEGALMMTDTYKETGGNMPASIGALLLGVATNAVTPGSVGSALARRMTSREGTAVAEALPTSWFGKSAFGRMAKSGAEEFLQEAPQEGGQALLEQLGRGEDLNLGQAGARAVVGGISGLAMGAGLHPVIGEGASPAAKAAFEAEKAAIQAGASKEDARTTAEQVFKDLTTPPAEPGSPEARGQAAATMAEQGGATPEEATRVQAQVTAANAEAAAQPDNQAAHDNATTVTAAAMLSSGASNEEIQHGFQQAATATQEAVLGAETLDDAFAAFSAGESASEIRIPVAGLEATAAAIEASQSLYGESETPEAQQAAIDAAVAEADRTAREQEKQRVAAMKQQHQVDKINAEREKIGLPTIDPGLLSTQSQTETALPTINEQVEAAPELAPATEAAPQEFQDARRAYVEYGQGRGLSPEDVAANEQQMRDRSDKELREVANDELFALPTRNYARAVLNQRTFATAPATAPATAREAFVASLVERGLSQQVAERAVEAVEAYNTDALSAVARNDSSEAQQFARQILAQRAAARRPQSSITSERRAYREHLLSRGYSPGNVDALVEDIENANERELVAMAENNDSPGQQFARALLAQRGSAVAPTEEASTPAPATPAPTENAVAQAKLDYVRSRRDTVSPEELAQRVERMLTDSNYRGDVIAGLMGANAEAQAFARAVDAREGTVRREPVARTRATIANHPRVTPTPAIVHPRVTPTPAIVHPAEELPQITQNFEARLEEAKTKGVLEKLARFWKSVVKPTNVGQRTLPPVPMADLKDETRAAVRAGRGIPQNVLNQVQDRYNAAIKAAAMKWAEDHNQTWNESAWINPISDIRQNNAPGYPRNHKKSPGFALKIRGLDRTAGANPFMVVDPNPTLFSADVSIHAVQLRNADGSGNLAYRIAAEVAELRGHGMASDGTLLTVNPLRRAMQSVSAGLLLGNANAINPISSLGFMTPQGMPSEAWKNLTPVQQIGASILRMNHSITNLREEHNSVKSAAAFTENLAFNREGQIYAYAEPRAYSVSTPRGGTVQVTNGWRKGTIVTDAMLKEKIGAVDPVTNVKPYEQDAHDHGGVGVKTARMAILNNTILNQIESGSEGTIKPWVKALALKEGKKQNGWFFSETGAGILEDHPITREDGHAALTEAVGDKMAKILTESGIINFVQNEEELLGDAFSYESGTIQGATDDEGRIYLVLDNLNTNTVGAVLRHEAIHGTLRGLVGQKTYDALMARLDTMVRAGEGTNWAKEAQAAIPEDTPAENHLEEIAAYAVEQAAKSPKSKNPLVRWAQDFMSAIRSAIIKSKMVPEKLRTWAINNLKAEDMVRLAEAGLRSRATAISAPAADHIAERNLTYSIASQNTAPVSPAPTNELNLMNSQNRSVFERIQEKIFRAIQDEHVDLRRIQRLAKVTGENIRMDVLGKIQRKGSKLQVAQENLVSKPLREIENILTRAGLGPDTARNGFDDLLKNRHVPEYNAQIEQINPAKYDENGVYISGFDAAHPGSGITDTDAATRIAELENGPHGEALLEAEKVYRKMIEGIQDYAVEAGLEKQSTVDTWRHVYPNYTPFQRDLELETGEGFTSGTGNNLSQRAGISRRAMGSSRDIISPLMSTMALGLNTTSRGENAAITQSFLAFAENTIPNVQTKTGRWVKAWEINTVPNSRVVRKLNVYRVQNADGTTQSSEIYTLAEAERRATSQRNLWRSQNPGLPVSQSPVAIVRPFGDVQQERVVTRPEPNHQKNKNVLTIPVNGENVTITFNEESELAMNVLESLTGSSTAGKLASIANRSALAIPFRIASKWVMLTSTGLNPVFMLFNAARDVQAAALSSGADKIPGWGAADSAAIIKNMPGATKSIFQHLEKQFKERGSNNLQTPPAPGSMAAWMEEMRAYGGATGIGNSMNDPHEMEAHMRRLFGQDAVQRALHPGEESDPIYKMEARFNRMMDTMSKFAEGESEGKVAGVISRQIVSRISRANEAAELATRTAAFKMAVEKYMAAGKTEVEAKTFAANFSKNLTTNFNRRGTLSSTIGTLFPFFNAAMQGQARFFETVFEKETYTKTKDGRLVTDQRTKLTPYGKKLVSALPAIGAAQALLLLAAGFDPDDVPDYVKDRAFVIPLPGEGKPYFAMPLPHSFNLIFNFGREMADSAQLLVAGKNKKAAEHFGHGIFSQIGAMNPVGGGSDFMSNISPALLDPVVGLYTNRDAFGRDISRKDFNTSKPTPGFTRGREGASMIATKAAEWTNYITGGDEDRPGWVSPAPEDFEFLAAFAGGGIGRETMKIGGAAAAAAKSLAGQAVEDIPLHKLPLISRLYGNAQSPTSLNARLYEDEKEINVLDARYKGLKERGEIEEAKAFKEENPEVVLAKTFAKVRRDETKLKKQRRSAREEGDIAKVNEITDKIEAKNKMLADKLEAYRKK